MSELNDKKASLREKKLKRKMRFRSDNRRSVQLIQELLKKSPQK
jgi:hypothetical protein